MGRYSCPAGEQSTVESINTVTQMLSLQLFASATVTQYIVVTEGVTVMGEVLSPLLQVYVPPPVAVSVVEVPDVMVTLALTLATGPPVDVTVTVVVLEHPLASVTVAVYDPAASPVAVALDPPEGDHEYV